MLKNKTRKEGTPFWKCQEEKDSLFRLFHLFKGKKDVLPGPKEVLDVVCHGSVVNNVNK